MAIHTSRTTGVSLLDAVNECLRADGGTPVSSLDIADIHADTLKALQVVNNTSVDVQSEKWVFNTENGYPLMPSPQPAPGGSLAPDGSTGSIFLLPANTLRVRAGARFDQYDVVQRGLQLYDRRNHTWFFPAALTTLEVDIAFALEWAQLPAPVAWYITALSVRRFVSTEVASQGSFQFSDREVQAARFRAEVNDAEIRNAPMDHVNPHLIRMTRR